MVPWKHISGLLDLAGNEFYKMNCYDLDISLDHNLLQQSPDFRLDDVDTKRAAAKSALRRRGNLVTMQLMFEVGTMVWISIFINRVIIDARIMRLRNRRSLLPAVFVGQKGHLISALPPIFSQV